MKWVLIGINNITQRTLRSPTWALNSCNYSDWQPSCFSFFRHLRSISLQLLDQLFPSPPGLLLSLVVFLYLHRQLMLSLWKHLCKRAKSKLLLNAESSMNLFIWIGRQRTSCMRSSLAFLSFTNWGSCSSHTRWASCLRQIGCVGYRGADSGDASQNLSTHQCRLSMSASLSRSSWICSSITLFIQATSAMALFLSELFILSSSPPSLLSPSSSSSPSIKASSILRTASCSGQRNLMLAWNPKPWCKFKNHEQTNQFLLHLLSSSPHLSTIMTNQKTPGGTNLVKAILYNSIPRVM